MSGVSPLVLPWNSLTFGSAPWGLYAYVNDEIFTLSPFTQRGVYAQKGAYVRARRNIWGVGGPENGITPDNDPNSAIDADNDCGSGPTGKRRL